MCGIMGFINHNKDGKLVDKQRDIIRELLKGIVIRGTDAAGVAIWHGDKKTAEGKNPPNISMFKGPMTSWEMADHKYFNNLLKRPVKMLIGHSRAGTGGDPELNINNHPFVTRSREVYLVHNGIIGSEGEREVKDLIMSDCDTEILIRSIEKHGIKEGFTKAAQWWRSSYAVLMLYPSVGKMYFLRRSNPMWYQTLSGSSIRGVYIASTKDILENSMKNAKCGEVSIVSSFKQLNENIIYSREIGQDLKLEKSLMKETKGGYTYAWNKNPNWAYKGGIYEGV